jgi:large subunit ribosomal protein L35
MKQKTKKAAAKRFKFTGTGKIMRNRQMQNHLKSAKSKTAMGRYKRTAQVSAVEKKTIGRMMPYES